jgi:D-alanyl-D-alanine carboxypeptidase
MKASLQRQLDKLRTELGIPGISAAVLFEDGTMWTGASGLADVAAKRPVTPDTPFAVGSISKTFTAALVVALAAEGRLDLDTSAIAYVPGIRIDPRITVRQLLDHTSGLNDFFFHPKIDAALLAEPGRRWLPADSLGYVGKPYFKPGKGYHYSNTNYLVLGMLAEAVGGAPVAEQLHRRFLDPLGLTSTTYEGSEPPAAAPAHGYRFTGNSLKLPPIDLTGASSIVPFPSVVTAAGAAGSIATTAEDLVRWARALYGGDALGEPSLRAMLGDVSRTSAYGRGAEYGLGVQSVVIDGRPTFGHSGRLLGARAVLRWLPTESMAIAVLTNQSRADPRTIARSLLRIAVVQPADCAACKGSWVRQ